MTINKCLLQIVENRLNDCLMLWKATKTNYFNPNLFRINLNSLIESLRSVTWILQNQKSELINFEEWYKKWQDQMRSDQILIWLKDSRNVIVKEGDLKTNSKIRVSFIESWNDSPSMEFEVSPFTKTEDIASEIARQRPDKIKLNVGLLRVERRWVDSKLPNYELSEATAHCFNFLHELLLDAHKNLLSNEISSYCIWYKHFKNFKGRTAPCMIAQDWDRTIWMDLEDNQILKPKESNMPKLKKEEVIKHYPKLDSYKNKKISKKKERNLKEEAKFFFEHAKYILSIDGYHVPTAILFYPNRNANIFELQMQNRAEKHLIYRKLAADIEKSGANGIIVIAESWVLMLDKDKKSIHPNNRQEALVLTAANSNGEVYIHRAIFTKDKNGKITFGKESTDFSIESLGFLTPIVNVLKKQKS